MHKQCLYGYIHDFPGSKPYKCICCGSDVFRQQQVMRGARSSTPGERMEVVLYKELRSLLVRS